MKGEKRLQHLITKLKKKNSKKIGPLYTHFQIPSSEPGAFFYIKKIRFHTLETLTCLQFQAPDQDLQKENIINVLLYKKNKIKISLPYFNNNLFLSFRLKSTKKRNNLCRSQQLYKISGRVEYPIRPEIFLTLHNLKNESN